VLAALPGLREIRSSLAAGYLWILFVWLLLDPSLGEGDFKAEPYQSAHHLGNELGPVALGVGVTFVAYLIGTLFNEGRALFSRLYLRARQSTVPLPNEAAAREALEDSRRKKKTAREEASDAWVKLTRKEDDGEDWLQRKVGLPMAFDRWVAALSAFSGALVSALLSALSAATGSILRAGELGEAAAVAGVRLVVRWRTTPYRSFLSDRGVRGIDQYLDRELGGNREEGPTVADLIADFPLVRARLLHQSVDTVSEIDRLRAEAEFRSAIFLPLLALVGVLVCSVSAWWLFVAPLMLTLIATAGVRRRDAGDLMADALVQGVVKAPSVEIWRRDV
jgi:hypothetical protein